MQRQGAAQVQLSQRGRCSVQHRLNVLQQLPPCSGWQGWRSQLAGLVAGLPCTRRGDQHASAARSCHKSWQQRVRSRPRCDGAGGDGPHVRGLPSCAAGGIVSCSACTPGPAGSRLPARGAAQRRKPSNRCSSADSSCGQRRPSKVRHRQHAPGRRNRVAKRRHTSGK